MDKTYKSTLNIMLLAFVSLFHGFFAGVAIAAEVEMICKNPRQSYQAVYDDKDNTFKLKTAGEVATYNVMRVDNTGNGLVIAGKTVKGGPDFVAYFEENRRIEFITDGSAFQTDQCE